MIKNRGVNITWMHRDIRKINLPGGDLLQRKDSSKIHGCGDSFHELFSQTVSNLSTQSDSHVLGASSSASKTVNSDNPLRQNPVFVSFNADAAPFLSESSCHSKCSICVESSKDDGTGFSLTELHQMAFTAGADKNVLSCCYINFKVSSNSFFSVI